MFQEYYSMVFNAAYRITGRPADAEDVLQTVFTRLLKHEREGRLDPQIPSNPKPYLYRSAINASVDLLRKRKRSKLVSMDGEESFAGDRVMTESRSHLSVDHGDRDRLQDALREALHHLSPMESQAFTLRYFEGHSNQDIAGMLKTTSNSVNVALHSARQKLQKALKPFA